jgi:hypothetical protein
LFIQELQINDFIKTPHFRFRAKPGFDGFPEHPEKGGIAVSIQVIFGIPQAVGKEDIRPWN